MNTTVRLITNKTRVVFPTGLPFTALQFMQKAVDALVAAGHVYENDEAAGQGGIAIGDVYITAFNHNEGPGGLIKIRLI